LVTDCAPVAISAFADLDRLMGGLHAESARAGIPLAESGHHAGELETSILLALDPSRVRAAAMVPGLPAGRNAQHLFYPDLRANPPDGVVGDPRRAEAARGLRYLRAWTSLLVDAYRGEKNSHQTVGTQNA